MPLIMPNFLRRSGKQSGQRKQQSGQKQQRKQQKKQSGQHKQRKQSASIRFIR